jgi:hypothetical protein
VSSVINLVNEIPMRLGGIETPGSAELRDVIDVRCARPGMCCVGNRDEADRREAFGEIASFADVVGNDAAPRCRLATGGSGPLVDHRFHRFGPPWPAASLVGVERIPAAVDGQQWRQLAAVTATCCSGQEPLP